MGGRSLEGWLSHMVASIVRRDPIKIKGKGVMELFVLCPKGVSSQLAMQLSKCKMQERVSISESELSFEPGDFLVREDRLKGEVSRLEASNQEAWAEVETLRLNLAESTATMLQINREM